MRSSALAQCLLTTALFAAGVNAHFQLQFPAPRGVFAEDPETGLCDGYLTAAPNRTEFPLSGGFFSLNSEHPSWTAGVTISTKANPTSFDDFQLVNTFFEAKGEGLFCFPLDFSKSNASSLLTSGQNVTIEVVFSGGDGQLYQCADLTLSDNFTIPSSVACTNGTGSTSTSGTGTPAPTSTSPGGAQTTNKSSALSGYASAHSVTAIVFAAFGLALA